MSQLTTEEFTILPLTEWSANKDELLSGIPSQAFKYDMVLEHSTFGGGCDQYQYQLKVPTNEVDTISREAWYSIYRRGKPD